MKMSAATSIKTNRRAPNNTILIRGADIILSFVGLIAVAPFILVIIFLIKTHSKGSAFFIQKRLGFHRKPFNLYKFRTMKMDAEESGPQWSKENDPRVTPIGRWLRKVRLDELPQLYNILKGDISFVGPRPIRGYFADILQSHDASYKQRFLLKPGLTGWAQIHASYGATIDEQLEKLPYDLIYMKDFSFLNYLQIILMTAKVVFLGKGI